MNEYLDKLNSLFILLKEEENGQQTVRDVPKDSGNSTRRDNGSSDSKGKRTPVGSNGGGSGDVFRRGISRQIAINNDTGKERVMITAEAAAKDLDEIEMSEVTDGVKVVRAIKVLVKFLSTMRSNQLLTDADKVAIQKAKANRKPEEKKT